MHNRLKNYALVICLFVFLFVIIGGGLHLAPSGAFLVAVTGTPLVIHAFQSRLRWGSSRDNSRLTTAENEVTMPATQPISLTSESATGVPDADVARTDLSFVPKSEPSPAIRRHLPDERRALTHHFSIAGQEGYLTVGVYEDGLPGEIFITMAKQGSTISGLMDSFATAVSLALQYGVPLEVLCGKFTHTRFEPSGWSGNPNIGYAKSIVDYIFRWLELKFITGEQGELFQPVPVPVQLGGSKGGDPVSALGDMIQMGDAPACNICGSLMVRSGTCYRCGTCGSASGCF